MVHRRLRRRREAAGSPGAAASSSARLQELSQPPEPEPRTPRRRCWSRCSTKARCRPSTASSAARSAGSALSPLDRAVGDEGAASAACCWSRWRSPRVCRAASAGLIARSPLAHAGRRRDRLRAAVHRPQGQADAAHARLRRAVPRGARPDLARAEGRPRVRDRAEDGRRRDARAGRSRVPEDVRRAELRSAAEGRARQPDASACRRSTCGSSPPPC